ncbi:acyl-CoA thioesterase [Parasphingorhabdus pacifica]
MLFRLIVVLIRTRTRGEAPLLSPSRVPLRVRLRDLDPLGHMNNGVYFSIFDLGRIDLMLRSGLYKRMRKRGWFAVVTAETGSFRRELKPFRRFELDSRVIGWDDRHLYFEHRVFSGGRLATNAVIQLRFLANNGERPTPEEVVGLLPDTPDRPELPNWVTDWAKSAYEHTRSNEMNVAS